MARCRVCPASILWATNEFTGRPMPLDEEPVESGNVWLVHVKLDRPPIARVVTREERARLEREHRQRIEQAGFDDEPLRLFVEHHATCRARTRVDAGELVGQGRLF
jgi:hypothetical protein